MGLRGPAPKPTLVRLRDGNPSRRPLPDNEPQYRAGIPDAPPGISAAAKKIWETLVVEMAASGVLRKVDGHALADLCEDQAMLDELRKGLSDLKREIAKKAKVDKKALPGGALLQLSRTNEGRRTLATIRELAGQIIIQRREFGLTPASNSRVSSVGGGGTNNMDSLEAALCG